MIVKTKFGKSLMFNLMLFLKESIALIIILLNIIKNDQIVNLLKVINYVRCLFIMLNKDLNILKL